MRNLAGATEVRQAAEPIVPRKLLRVGDSVPFAPRRRTHTTPRRITIQTALAFDETMQAQRSFEVEVELDFRKIADELQRGALTHGGAMILRSATLFRAS